MDRILAARGPLGNSLRFGDRAADARLWGNMDRRPPIVLLLGLLLAACASPRSAAPPIAVTVVVDYGESGREPTRGQTLLPPGASPIEALIEVADVEQRFVTRTAADVWSVEGLATDPKAGLYWEWTLNGRRVPEDAHRYVLANGDLVTWRYAASRRTSER
jgi:hypothetical protein